MSMFGLKDRLVLTGESATKQHIETPIDWDQVNRTRHEQAEKSRTILRKVLK